MPSIDFKRVRESVSISKVLDLLGFAGVQDSGDQVRGPCPLHGSLSPTSRVFSVNLRKNAFQCFKCGKQGNQIDLWAQSQELPIFDAAIDLCDRLGVPVPWVD